MTDLLTVIQNFFDGLTTIITGFFGFFTGLFSAGTPNDGTATE